MDAAAGVSRGAREVEAVDRRGCAAEAGDGAEHQLLVQLGGAPINRTVNEIPVVCLQVGRGLDVSRAYGCPESGRVRLDACLDSLDVSIELGGREPQPTRQVGVCPGGLGASRRAGWIGRGHLPEQDEWPGRDATGGEVGSVVGEAVHVDAEMDGSG